MGIDEFGQADVVRAFENMSDDEAAAWVSAGDYTSVAGIALPEEVSKQFEEQLSGDEVAGFAMGPSLGLMTPPYGGTQVQLTALFKNCAKGAHFDKVTLHVRAAGKPTVSG